MTIVTIPFPAVREIFVSEPMAVPRCKVPETMAPLSTEGDSGLLLSLSELDWRFLMTKKLIPAATQRKRNETRVTVMVVPEFEPSELFEEVAEDPMTELH